MTDNDRLRTEINTLRRERDAHQMDESDYTDKVLALIAREVRLGKIEELKKMSKDLWTATAYWDDSDRMSEIDYRITELEKELPNV